MALLFSPGNPQNSIQTMISPQVLSTSCSGAFNRNHDLQSLQKNCRRTCLYFTFFVFFFSLLTQEDQLMNTTSFPCGSCTLQSVYRYQLCIFKAQVKHSRQEIQGGFIPLLSIKMQKIFFFSYCPTVPLRQYSVPEWTWWVRHDGHIESDECITH